MVLYTPSSEAIEICAVGPHSGFIGLATRADLATWYALVLEYLASMAEEGACSSHACSI